MTFMQSTREALERNIESLRVSKVDLIELPYDNMHPQRRWYTLLDLSDCS